MLLVSGRKARESERKRCKALEQTNPESLNTLEVVDKTCSCGTEGHGVAMDWVNARLTVGLNDLKGLFQPK